MKTLFLVAICALLVSFKSPSPSIKIILYPSSYTEYREALKISSDTTFDDYSFEIVRTKKKSGDLTPLKAEFICCKTGIKLGEFFKSTMVTSNELKVFGFRSMALSKELSRWALNLPIIKKN
jgi:hypothetical protein